MKRSYFIRRILLSFSVISGLLLIACEQKKAERPVPTAADVRYGKFDRNVLDFWKAPTATSDDPAPLLVFYHGGGWLMGDKKLFNPDPWLAQGISVASVNYRFTARHPDAAPYPAPMQDSARALQFVRSKANEWSLDPDRVALSGSSAGAVIAMWIGYRDDMADPNSEDPVERISTRVTCLLPTDMPTTLDPELILTRIGGKAEIHPAILPLFDIESVGDLKNPDKAALLKDADPLSHLSADDPPTYCLFNGPRTETPLPATTDVSISIHHPEFGVLLKERLDALGVEAHVQWKDDGKKGAAPFLFLMHHLGVAVQTGK